MDILDPIPDTRVLSLLLTLQCNAECLHCGTNSSPRVKSRLPEATAARLIDEASRADYQVVAFTGGEPLLYGPPLFELVRRAAGHGLTTRVVSNAYWARTAESASRIVATLTAAGLKEINFSTGDQHARFVPMTNVIRAARAALDHKLRVAVMIETVKERSITREKFLADPLFVELFDDAEREMIYFCESPWMPLDPNQHLEYPDNMAVTSDNIGHCTGCDSVINTTTVLADGRVMACCGLGTQQIPELQLGKVDDGSLTEMRSLAENDFLKRWIRCEGPERILQWAAAKNTAIAWEGLYAHRCQACVRVYSDEAVRSIIREHYEEKIMDVLASEWLTYTYPQAQQTDS
jgi:organic radical activating enzyme